MAETGSVGKMVIYVLFIKWDFNWIYIMGFQLDFIQLDFNGISMGFQWDFNGI